MLAESSPPSHFSQSAEGDDEQPVHERRERAIEYICVYSVIAPEHVRSRRLRPLPVVIVCKSWHLMSTRSGKCVRVCGLTRRSDSTEGMKIDHLRTLWGSDDWQRRRKVETDDGGSSEIADKYMEVVERNAFTTEEGEIKTEREAKN